MGKIAEARQSYEQSLRLDPDNEEVRQSLQALDDARTGGGNSRPLK